MYMEAIFTSHLITVLSQIAHNCPLVPVQSQADGRQSPSLHNKVVVHQVPVSNCYKMNETAAHCDCSIS